MLYFYRLVYPLVMYIYLWWGRVYRRLFLRGYETISFARFKTPTEVGNLMAPVGWRPDTWLQLWDVCGTAARFEYIRLRLEVTGTQPDLACDCDDFAAYAVEMLHPMYHPKMMFVAWRTHSRAVVGHAVCLFGTRAVFGHMGNWGVSVDHPSWEAVARDIANVKKPGNQLIGYTVTNAALDKIFCLLRG